MVENLIDDSFGVEIDSQDYSMGGVGSEDSILMICRQESGEVRILMFGYFFNSLISFNLGVYCQESCFAVELVKKRGCQEVYQFE